MIRIIRGVAPQDFLRRSAAGRKALLKQYQRHANTAANAPFKPTFDSKIWNAAKGGLRRAQHGKCAYTEATLEDVESIEHFRPKGSVRNHRTAKPHQPGYFWLAYEWDNLLLTNYKVNNSKDNCFPLAKPTRRATSPRDPLGQEYPMLIDPAQEDPRQHIRFRRDAPYGITDRGRKTVALLGLNEAYLREKRLKRLEQLRTLLQLAEILPAIAGGATVPPDVEGQLTKSKQPEAEFSSMAIDFLASQGR